MPRELTDEEVFGTQTDRMGRAVTSMFPGSTVTSGYRDPAKNAKVGGARNSYHTRGQGQAIDFVKPPGADVQQIRAGLEAQGYPVTELLDEGDHIHWAAAEDVAPTVQPAELSDEEVFGSAAPQPQRANPKPAATKRGQRRSVSAEVSGLLANLNRGIGIGDEIAGGTDALGDMLTGKAKADLSSPQALGRSFRGAFDNSMKGQRAIEDDFMARRPVAANLARGTGMAPTVFIPGGAAAKATAASSRAVNAARGGTLAAGQGAAFGLVDRGSAEERVGDANTGALFGGLLGAGAGALAPARRNVTDGNTLANIGVSTTIPQKIGGPAKQVEDLLMRLPILGQAVSGARNRQIEQLNRGVGLKALEPIGAKLPKKVKPGFEMVQAVEDALSDVYTKATARVPRVVPDQPFLDDLAAIAERKADLAETVAKQYDSIVANRLARLQKGSVSGAMVKKIHGELGKLSGEAAKKGEDTLSSMLADTRKAVMGIVARADPEAGEMIAKADAGWGIYSMMNDAAAAASNRGGVFLPGQLNTQVRAAGKRQGSNMTGKGKAPLQDIATAAARTLPDSYGNPGTANAGLLAGGGIGFITEPATTAGVATGLLAASTPYFAMGRKIIDTLPENATAAQLSQAADDLGRLAANEPALAPYHKAVLERLSRAGGMMGAANDPRASGVGASIGDGPVYWGDGRVTGR